MDSGYSSLSFGIAAITANGLIRVLVLFLMWHHLCLLV